MCLFLVPRTTVFTSQDLHDLQQIADAVMRLTAQCCECFFAGSHILFILPLFHIKSKSFLLFSETFGIHPKSGTNHIRKLVIYTLKSLEMREFFYVFYLRSTNPTLR